MEDLDANGQQRRETFARYGLAMYHAQRIEKSLSILVSIVFNKEFLPSSQDHREEIQNEVFAETIGRLLTRMRKQVTIPPNLDKTLSYALQKRNWLARDYFWDRAGEWQTNAGRNKMLDELTKLDEFFSKVDAHLTSIYGKWTKKIGLPQDAIDKAVKELINSKE